MVDRALLLVALVCLGCRSAPLEDSQVYNFLKKFQYIQAGENAAAQPPSTAELEQITVEGLRLYQKENGLKVTGKVDSSTRDLMNTPRCGLPDIQLRFASISAGKLEKKDLTYSIAKFPNDGVLKNQNQLIRDETRKAFDQWQAVTPLTFTDTTPSAAADIVLKFEARRHGGPGTEHQNGRGFDFDGKGGTLAHANLPVNSRRRGSYTHLDQEEDWTSVGGVALLNTLTHEIGHNLGLRHLKGVRNMMQPHHDNTLLSLTQIDIDRIQEIYGEPDVSTTSTSTTSTTTTTSTTRTSTGTLCDGVDALIQDQQGTYFAFKGERVWRLVGKGVAGSGYRISDKFPGIPAFLDTAFTCTGACPGPSQAGVGVRINFPGSREISTTAVTARTYFFKGDEFWSQDQGSSSGPSKVSDHFPGLPGKLDAAFQYNRNKAVYFFRGSEYWKYDTKKGRMADGYPKPISQHWGGIPDNLDGVLPDWDIWSNNNNFNSSYFFRGSQYWRLDVHEKTLKVEGNYPKDSEVWFKGGCEVEDDYYDYYDDSFENLPRNPEPEDDPRYEPLDLNSEVFDVNDLVLP